LLTEPTNRCVLPDVPWPIPKLLKPPNFAFQLVVELLGLFAVAGLSRSSYSLAVRRDEVEGATLRVMSGMVLCESLKTGIHVICDASTWRAA